MRLPVLFILITVLLDSMGIGIIMPVMPQLIQELHGGDLGNAAVWGGLLTTVFALMQFLFSPTVGSISDRFGRRIVLLTALFVMMLDYLLMAVAGTIWLLFIGRVIGGLTAATQATANAYMADISEDKERAANFGLIGAAFGLGFVLGPLIGGLLAGYGSRAPFYAAAVFAFANFLFGYFVLPEPVTEKTRRAFSWRRANPLGALKAIGRLPGQAINLVIAFFYDIAFFVYPAIWAYFGMERFGWSPQMVGLSLTAFGIGMAIVQAVLVRPVVARLGERGAVILGFSVDIVAFIALGFVTNGTIALLLTPLAALGSIAGPPFQGIMANATPADQQGELQGVKTSIHALAAVIAPLLMTQIFWLMSDDTGAYLPGAPFIVSAGLVAVALMLFTSRRRTNPLN